MKKSLLRIPYPGPLPPPKIIPRNAVSLTDAIAALTEFLTAPPSRSLPDDVADPASTVLLTGAGLSVASGLADYRGTSGTYTLKKSYRPIYYHEFLASHEARKRYWARSFLGWANLHKAGPNSAHFSIKELGDMGFARSVITQNVDSFHLKAHPQLPTLELHGYLRALICLSCHSKISRDEFQKTLMQLNPIWAAFLEETLFSRANPIKNTAENFTKSFSTNPDGDVDVPGAPYSMFRYPACPNCFQNPPMTTNGLKEKIDVDKDGAWKAGSNVGILKPSVVMFGESIASEVKEAAEQAIDNSGRLLVLGTSLATYSAWRLAKRAKDRGMPIAIINFGGVRGEEEFFHDLLIDQNGGAGVRIEFGTEIILPQLVANLQQIRFSGTALTKILNPNIEKLKNNKPQDIYS
ncbi:NAD-dependent protein deacylase SIR4 [Golovinomyces cichoracearum]|uniref:NAD-dependent protein deacylase SIR4 n=1 Tax=Golovinomyces cichoracearum TaxID=62708 RepID=A0A420IV19_9PEZI|nr:NAD-dependent protein deacylase SIR4 [Golovinomyces cichoracearum]